MTDFTPIFVHRTVEKGKKFLEKDTIVEREL